MSQKVLFVIITWNSEKYIKSCIDSILNVDLKKRIIVIDNGSIDYTLDYLDSYCEMITIVPLGKNLGTTFSRNIALRMIDHDISYSHICILDSDTVINQQAIYDMIEYMNSDSKIGIVGPKMKNLNGEEQKTYKKFPTIIDKFLKFLPLSYFNRIGEKIESYNIDSEMERDYLIVDYLISACWLIKSGTLKDVGLLDEKIFYSPEDVDYCLRARKKGWLSVYCAKSEIIHDTQRITKKNLISKIKLTFMIDMIYYFFKHKYFIRRPKFDLTKIMT